jgi:hypothetical protein
MEQKSYAIFYQLSKPHHMGTHWKALNDTIISKNFLNPERVKLLESSHLPRTEYTVKSHLRQQAHELQ